MSLYAVVPVFGPGLKATGLLAKRVAVPQGGGDVILVDFTH